jgi:maltose/moltooligosaccharide transporter
VASIAGDRAGARTGSASVPVGLCLFLGLGGLATGAIGPLYSTFVPPMARAAVANDVIVGLILAIDNVLLFLLVPWMGALSDRRAAAGRDRRLLVVSGLVVAAAGMAMLRLAPAYGLAGLLAAIVVLNTGQFAVRAPFQALVVDLVASPARSFAMGAITGFMCLGAIVFLGLANALGSPNAAFLAAAATLLAVAIAFAARLREPAMRTTSAAETSFALLRQALGQVLAGTFPGMRVAFVALLFIHLSFQTFTSWFTLHAAERFGITPAEAAIGFIVWAVGGLFGSVPAGIIGMRIGRRNALLAGLGAMALALVALDGAPTMQAALPLVFAVSFAWSLPWVNAFPLLVEPFPRARRGVLAAMFFICMALGGMIGDPLNGTLFEWAGTRRFLFLAMAVYTAAAFVAVLRIPRGAGEAGTGA